MYTFYMKNMPGFRDEGKSMWYMNELDKDKAPRDAACVTTTEYATKPRLPLRQPIPDLTAAFRTGSTLRLRLRAQPSPTRSAVWAWRFGICRRDVLAGQQIDGQNWHKDIFWKAWSRESRVEHPAPAQRTRPGRHVGPFSAERQLPEPAEHHFWLHRRPSWTAKFGVTNCAFTSPPG